MPRRILEGNVVSDKMDKTITILVERRYKHPVYKKYIKRTDKFAAHDENNTFKIGDRVQIQECRPISKRKTWTVLPADGSLAKKPVVTKPVSTPTAKEEAPKIEAKAEKKTAKKPEVKGEKK